MNGKSRLASYVPKGKEKQAMKQQKAMLIALIVICLISVRLPYSERPPRSSRTYQQRIWR
ncbi:TPA: hypothetical protein IQK33_004385 [Escherichia coli]|nr:hypothetical protein [Escherichia coli]